MPLPKGTRYAMKKTAKGMMRLAWSGGKVVETKNMKTGAKHTMAEFAADRRKAAKRKASRRMR